MQTVCHTIEPVFDGASRVLILGSIPSPKSREVGFYYGHPQNRFWRVLAAVAGTDSPEGNDAKRAFLLQSHIALWDVLASCDIAGAADSSIKNPTPNDLRRILLVSPIKAIFTTGATAARLYKRLFPEGMPAIALPSTSPANCSCPMEELIARYRVIAEYLR